MTGSGPNTAATASATEEVAPVGQVRVVIDTDAANEIDDQFAVVYALFSPERLRVEALYAAPFQNREAVGPEEGMRRSYEELVRILALTGRAEPPIREGSGAWLPTVGRPVPSAAADDLVERALAAPEPLYVVTLGAPTNVASALLLAPEIRGRVVVVWLGGNPGYWHRAVEFNVSQDPHASRVLLDTCDSLVHVPCVNVAEHLRTTQAEVDRFVRGRGRIGDYLAGIYDAYLPDHFGRSKPLWDVGPVAWLVNPAWVPTVVVHSPLLTSEGTWSHDPSRHLIREARRVDRDAVFADLFRKLDGDAAAAANAAPANAAGAAGAAGSASAATSPAAGPAAPPAA